jgi:16S rRNA (cytosine967-C5)-methyltransferase
MKKKQRPVPERIEKMRGVEAALHVWNQAVKGGTISESLRALGPRVSESDRTLAASLCYAMSRRLSLWEHLCELYLLPRPSKFSRTVQTAVLAGAAGLMELKNFAPAVLISALIDWTKPRDPRGARVVNAVLRKVLEQGLAELERLAADTSAEALCLLSGVPLWIGQRWIGQYGESEGRRIIALQSGPAALSLRLSPGAPENLAGQFENAGVKTVLSPLPQVLRLEGTALPTALPGYKEGWFTPQTESSIMVGREAARFSGDFLLDMCAGRGVKTGQIAQLRPEISVEGWDLSKGRIAAAIREMQRLGLAGRTAMKQGDALTLQPAREPDAVLTDAPCSGSGTWRRHPEGKWRLMPESLSELAGLQTALLIRAFELVRKGGRVIYSTCSLLAEENEETVRRALQRCPDIRPIEMPLPENARRSGGGCLILPENPWTDGFYIAGFSK